MPDHIATTRNGTGVLLKDEAPIEAKATWREILALALIVFAFGFFFYVLLMFRTGGM